jgi:hypothetical protein
MIVDDLDYNRFFLKKLVISKFGFKIEEATNGKDCVEKVEMINKKQCCKGI